MTQFNVRMIMSTIVYGPIMILMLLIIYRGKDWFNLLVLPTLALLKVFQNYLLCALEGDRIVVSLGM